jgi:hypothetical protein
MKLSTKQHAIKIHNNKTIHLEIPGDIHRKLRALLFLREMSQQGFFRHIAERFVNGDEYLNDLVIKKVDDIKNKKVSVLQDISTKELYDAIEQNSPFEEED